jgi:hypothetical protein
VVQSDGKKSILVFKDGGRTDLTMGHLRHVCYDLSRTWYELSGKTVPSISYDQMSLYALGDLSFESSKRHDAHQWVGVVDWTSPDVLFSPKGDSGSLIHGI